MSFQIYKNHRVEPYFTYVKNGQKTVEGRLCKEWYQQVCEGDHIIVQNMDETDSVEVVVKDVRRHDTIRDMLEQEDMRRLLPNVESVEDGLKIYRQFYTEEQERQYGVVAIEVERFV